MLKYIFIIALALPACVFSQKKKTESWTLDPQCIKGSVGQVNRDKSSTQVAGFSAQCQLRGKNQAFSHQYKMLLTYNEKKDSESLKKFNTSVADFTKVVNANCAAGKMPSEVTLSFYVDLVVYAVKEKNLSDFISTKGESCVESVKPDILKCINRHLSSSSKSNVTDNVGNKNATKAINQHVEESGATGGAGGANGITGSAGANGPIGTIDVAGPNSAIGTAGVAGANGPIGTAGVAGADGMIGSAGVTGANGMIGSAGVAGANGMIGSAGVAGANGSKVGATTGQINDDLAQLIHNLQGILNKTDLEFNTYTCDKTKLIRDCVVKKVKQHNATCTPEHSTFVKSLFDFGLSKCPKPVVASKVQPNGGNSFFFNPVVILLSLLGTMLMN